MTIPAFAPRARDRYSGPVKPSTLSTLISAAGIIALVMVSSGCPKAKRRTLVPDVPTSGDRDARARFQEAKSDFERDRAHNAAEFEAIAESYPDDPIAAYALLYAGIASVEAGDHEAALQSLEKVAEDPAAAAGLRARGQLFLGMARAHLGRYDQALEPLKAGVHALESEAERTRFHASMAETLARTDRPLDALSHYQRFYASATVSEQAFVIARLEQLANDADRATAERVYRESGDKSSPVAVVFGVRAAALWRDAGEIERARAIEDAIAAGARAMGIPIDRQAAGTGGDPGKLAAILPLSGVRARVGEPAMRGLALAAGTFAGARGGDLEPFQVSMHDTGSTGEGATSAFEACLDEGAIAVIGPIDGKSVDAVAGLAHSRGLAMISLNVRSGRRARENSRFVFHMLHSAEDRAEALARRAFAAGVTRFAILAPDSGYGRAVGQAFREEVARLGGRVTAEVAYPARATSFGSEISKLGRDYQALFIPEQADRLELIAPALAAADLRVSPLDAVVAAADKKPRRSKQPGRRIGLLSTAELLDAEYVRSAARYSEGALFAPGFYPDREDALIRDFVDRFEVAFGRPPTPLDAYAYDAARMVRKAVDENGADARGRLADILSRMRLSGLTGEIAFGDKHRRADDGLVFEAVRTRGGHAIRALR